MRMITQSNRDELNISRILIQCSVWECSGHTCKVPRRGDMTVVVFDEIDIDDDLLCFAILLLLLLLFLSNRVRRSVLLLLRMRESVLGRYAASADSEIGVRRSFVSYRIFSSLFTSSYSSNRIYRSVSPFRSCSCSSSSSFFDRIYRSVS